MGTYNRLFIGSFNGTNTMRGNMNDFRIYNKQLVINEIKVISYKTYYYPDTLTTSNAIYSYRLNSYDIPTASKNRELLCVNFNDIYSINYELLNFTRNAFTYPVIYNNQLLNYNVSNSYYNVLYIDSYYQYSSNLEIKDLTNTMYQNGFVMHFVFQTIYTTNTQIFNISSTTNTIVFNVRIFNNKLWFDFENKLSVYTDNDILSSVWYKVNFIYRYLDYQNILIELYLNGIKQPIRYVMNTRDYIRYEFRSSTLLTFDSSGNGRSFTNNGGIYATDSIRNSILLTNGKDATLPTTSWNTFSTITLSGWFKTSGFVNNDRI